MMSQEAAASQGKRAGEAAARQPLYARVHDALRREIAEGRIAPGDRLPTETELCRRFGVSRITIRHALQLLRAEGAIVTHSARPAIVRPPPRFRSMPGRLDTLDDLIAGASGVSLDISSWSPERRPEIARLFGLLAATPLPCLKSLLVRDNKPFARSAIYFHPNVGEKLEQRHFDDVIVFRVMQRETGIIIRALTMTATAEAAGAEDAAELGIAAGAPMLCSRLIFRTKRNAPVQISLTRYPGDAGQVSHTVGLEGWA
jgi:GntR family transcriptional regulator